MNGRSIVRLRYVLALVLCLAVGAVAEVAAQEPPTRTHEVAVCINNAADAFVQCVDRSWVDILCGLKYIADSLLCLPSVVFSAN